MVHVLRGLLLAAALLSSSLPVAAQSGCSGQFPALTVCGNGGTSQGLMGSIAAGANYNILRRNGTSIGFGAIDLSQSGAVGASILPGANGGTGVANTGKTITIGGNVTFSGAFTFTGTLTGNTGVTFPTSGTLATTAGASIPSIAQGDLLYGSASNTLSTLSKNTSATRYLSNTGTSNNPAWAQVDLSNGVTGTLACSSLPLGVDCNTLNAQTTAYALQASDCGKTVTLGGTAFYTLTVGAASGFSSTCSVVIVNTDSGRAKLMSISGLSFPNSNRLWPKQAVTIKNENNTWTITSAPGPWEITSAVTFNVDTASGSDASDCLGALGTSGACALLSTAINRFCQVAVVNNAQVTFQLATGQSHAAQGLCVYRSAALQENTNPPQVLGDTSSCSNAANYTVDGISAVGIYTPWAFRGVKMTGTGGTAIAADNHSRIYLGASINFPTVTGFHMRSLYNSFIEFVGNYCITGNAAVHANSVAGGQILIQPGLTVTLSNSPVFTYFAQIYSSGLQTWTGTTFTGTSATGSRFSIDTGGGLATNGAGASFLPGSTAGTATNPGWYN